MVSGETLLAQNLLPRRRKEAPMKRRSISAGICFLAVLFFFYSSGSAREEIHPCLEVYGRCAIIALSSNLSLRQTAEWIYTCTAMYVACLMFYSLPPLL